ncbi:MATE family efflux transporter [bacterium SCSIO 12741]|nr:MATE family efflux transporter [bacterium SCSIO 12741]
MSESPANISYNNILRIAAPIMVSGLSMTLVNLTDTLFLSKLGEKELGGVGNAGLIFFLLVFIGMGFNTGSQIMISRRNGERNYASIGSLYQHVSFFLLLWGILIFTFLHTGLSEVLQYLVESDDIRDINVRFLESRSFGVFFNFINITFFAVYIGTTKTKIIGIVTPITALINVALDYCLIFGKFGFPAWGVEGAAWASNLAELTATLILISYTIWGLDHRKYRLFQWQGLDRDRFMRMFKISTPLMIQNTISFSAWLGFFMIIEHLGTDELAVSHMVRSLYMVLIIPVLGLGDTANTLTGNLMGQGLSNHVYTLLKRTNVVGLAIAAGLLPLYFIFGGNLLAPFTDRPELIEMGKPVLSIIFSVLFVFVVVIVGFRTLSGTGKTLVGLGIESISVFIYLITAWYFAHFDSVELYHPWLSEYVYFGFFASLVYLYLWKGKWQDTKV